MFMMPIFCGCRTMSTVITMAQRNAITSEIRTVSASIVFPLFVHSHLFSGQSCRPAERRGLLPEIGGFGEEGSQLQVFAANARLDATNMTALLGFIPNAAPLEADNTWKLLQAG